MYIYILVSGVCTCTAACSEFKGGESNRSGGKRRYSEGEGGEWNRNEKQKEDEIGEEEDWKVRDKSDRWCR